MPTPIPLLLVEDDDLVARAVARALKISDYAVTRLACYADGQRFIAAAAQATAAPGSATSTSYPLGVFDINLGDGDGVKLAAQMLEHGLVNHVVFFTATTDSHSHERALHLGTLVSKTAGTRALQASLAQALTRVCLTRSGTLPRVIETELGAPATPPAGRERLASDRS